MGEAGALAKRTGGVFPHFVGQNLHLTANQYDIVHTAGCNRPHQRCVVGRAMFAQFLHRPQNGDPPLGMGYAQLRQRRLHRGGIGVIAFIDQQRPARAIAALCRQCNPLAAPFEAFHLSQRQSSRAQIAARCTHGGHHGERVGNPMLARFSDGVADLAVAQIGGNQRSATRSRNSIEQPHIGVSRPAKADCGDTELVRCRLDPRMVRAIGGNDRGAARLQPFEDFGLGIGNRLFTAEHFDMRRSNRGDHRDVRADLRGQRGDLSRVVHTHFKHAELAARSHPGQAERNADMVVIALDGAVRPAPARSIERSKDGLFHAGLAD